MKLTEHWIFFLPISGPACHRIPIRQKRWRVVFLYSVECVSILLVALLGFNKEVFFLLISTFLQFWFHQGLYFLCMTYLVQKWWFWASIKRSYLLFWVAECFHLGESLNRFDKNLPLRLLLNIRWTLSGWMLFFWNDERRIFLFVYFKFGSGSCKWQFFPLHFLNWFSKLRNINCDNFLLATILLNTIFQRISAGSRKRKLWIPNILPLFPPNIFITLLLISSNLLDIFPQIDLKCTKTFIPSMLPKNIQKLRIVWFGMLSKHTPIIVRYL